MNKTTKITEADKEIIASWYTDAKAVKSPKALASFVKRLAEDYDHDYGTIVEACAAAANAAIWAVNASPQGGITGFQAGCIMWRFIRHFMSIDGPMKLVKYEDMIFPQYASDFDKTIPESVFKGLQELAKKKLETAQELHPNVRTHMQSIVDGVVPFGHTLKNG